MPPARTGENRETGVGRPLARHQGRSGFAVALRASLDPAPACVQGAHHGLC